MEQLLTTDTIQAESLRLFMTQLGYRPHRFNGGWVTDNPALAGNRTISTRTAIRLHNMKRKDWVELQPGWFGPAKLNIGLAVNAYALNVLRASKLVKQVKLQPSKTAPNGLKMPPDPLAHLIKVVDERYWTMFGTPS